MHTSTDRLGLLRRTLDAHGQTHLLRFHEGLDETRQATLLDQLEGIDFEALDGAWTGQAAEAASLDTGAIEPAPYYAHPPSAPAEGRQPYDDAKFRKEGEALIRAGRIAAFTVAGGQGTRLGWNGPKGTYPATPVTGKPLFRCFAEQLVAAQGRYGVTIPWYIMTSPENDARTRAFFLDNNCFGLVRKNIVMFPQGTMPALDAATGQVLLAEPHAVASSPDGHGGSIKALAASGAIEDMRRRGIEQISYFQVDNPLVRVIDPLFVGLHAVAPDSSAEMSSKMVVKTDPAEKVGVFARVGGKTSVLEYSDLPESLATAREATGDLRYRAGSIAIHLLSVEFVERLTADAHHFGLPYHRALKKMPHVDLETGGLVEPGEPNAIKLETFVFDVLPLAESSIVLEARRTEEFAPIKNARGADSTETSHRLQVDRAGRWLEAHGVPVPRDADGHVDARIEISSLTALEPADLVAIDLPQEIARGQELVL